MTVDDEKLAYIGRRAYELAQSGHLDFASIRSALFDEGRAEGTAWLDVPGVDAALEQICSIVL
jgi:hypothetical protein